MIVAALAISRSVPVSTSSLCRALGIARASFYRAGHNRAITAREPRTRSQRPDPAERAHRSLRPAPSLPTRAPIQAEGTAAGPGRPLAAARSPLSRQEAEGVLAILHDSRFIDRSPREAFYTLLDEGVYLCSVRTMYRLLASCGEVRERRCLRRHPHYPLPELLAAAPNQVWSWDITKLRGPAKYTYYSLYVILDIFSRYVTGWLLTYGESAEAARQLIAETYQKQGLGPGQVTLHADRGAPMKAQSFHQKLASLGVERSYSRPRVSNDNPYSESQFKTMKYGPEYPERFGGFEDALAFLRGFIPWYNHEHRHSGIAYLTPEVVHYGLAPERQAHRQRVLEAAYGDHPDRFGRKVPNSPMLPPMVWINRPKTNFPLDDREGGDC